MNKRRFKAPDELKDTLRRELEFHLEGLSHDPQYTVRRACRILEVLALPNRLKRSGQIEELCRILALHREKRKRWGRAWTVPQLRRVFYVRSSFRTLPKPVTQAEVEAWVPPVELPPKGRRRPKMPENPAA